ncbi:MAG TPA: hypothetical protein VN181_09930, partial [Thermoanaerobaculia bacterium]|nr:hypothetical protein [Thermoanaerobaculia bacterium]
GTERPSATVIDTLLLTGSFSARSLAVAFSGRSVGTRPVVRAFEGANDVTIANCSGDAILTRTAKGAFSLVPLKDAFTLTCNLYVSGSDRLRMHVLQGVLAVRSNVSDGELISGDESDDGARDYSLVRHVGGPGEALPATATGRYLVTLLPDATRFRYTIEVHNPNRTPSPIDVVLASNEHLQQIDSAAPYDVNGNRYSFVIPPGDSTISMNGELRGTAFAAPVRASLQYLVIESHPLLRPRVETPAKRISVGETGITPQYRGAIAFETNAERIGWSVTRLEALHTISYAVNDVRHTLFVPTDGAILGESTLAIHNEGAPELLLPPRPEPTYVSLQNEPVLMTKDKNGRVSVPLSAGDQQIVAQHRQPFHRKLGFGYGTVAVPSLDVPATQTSVRLSYPEEWRPVFESFASEMRLWLPSTGDVLLLVVLAFWFERVLAWVGLAAKKRVVIAIAIAAAASLVSSFLWISVLVFGAMTVLWMVVLAKSGRLTVLRGLAAAGILVA